MDEGVGVACGQCDLFNPVDAVTCAECGSPLTFGEAVTATPLDAVASMGDTDAGLDLDSGLPTPLEILPPIVPSEVRAAARVVEPPTVVSPMPEGPAPRTGARRGGRAGRQATPVAATPPPVVPDLDASSSALPIGRAEHPASAYVPDLDGPSAQHPVAAPEPPAKPATVPPPRLAGRGGAVFVRPPEVVPPTAVAHRGAAAPAPAAGPHGPDHVGGEAPPPSAHALPVGPAQAAAPGPEVAPPWFPAAAPPEPAAPAHRFVDAPPDFPAGSGAAPSASAVPPRGADAIREEEWMDQVRNFVCRSCQTPVPTGHKFCGRCGAAVPPEILNLRTKYFSEMQAPGKVKLILIKGEGDDGISYQLQATEHVAGRSQGQILFPHDNWLSPRHANFVYRGNKLVVRDEGSLNGIYLRVREGTVTLEPGDTFLCGEQLLRLDPTPRTNDSPEADQTYFYSSPKRPSPFRLSQILRGGGIGMVHCARESTVTIGREGVDMNFPEDPYISASHAKVEADATGRFSLSDLGSKNGTYLRVKQESELVHGDYLFLGKQLLRVEIT